MNARTCRARRVLRDRSRANRVTSRARRLAASAKPQSARVLLVAAGLDDTTAHQFAGAFSRGVVPTAVGRTRVKLAGSCHRWYPTKLYSPAVFAARLAVYRPRNAYAAGRFAALAQHATAA